MRSVFISRDSMRDVLHVEVADTEAHHETAHGELLLDYDGSGQIVGARISKLRLDTWRSHPCRAQLPDDFLLAIDAWLEPV